MHLHNMVLLAVVLLASTRANAQMIKSDIELTTPSLISYQHNTLTGKLLRSHKTSYEEEERGIPTTGVESLLNSLESTITSKQLEAWLKKGDTTDDVFKLLTLDKAADDLLSNPQLQAWINYIKIFNTENPKQQTTLIKTLTSHYGDEGLAKIIEAAKQVPTTATIAKRLQTEQIQRWLGQNKSPDDIFKLMKLDLEGDELFKQPQVITWAKYVHDFNKAHPDQKATLFSAVMTYDEQTLVDMLIAAKNVPTTEKIAVQIQGDLTNAWLFKMKKTPNDVFKLLKPHTDGDNLLESPIFNAWMQYTDEFNVLYPNLDEPVISTLMKQYPSDKLANVLVAAHKNPSTEKLANQLHIGLLEGWFQNGNAPSYVFKRLQLDKTGDKLFDSANFTTWLKYIAYFREKSSNQKVSAVSILKEHYDDDVLAKLLVEARKDPSTQTNAASLLDSLTNRWMSNRKSPAMVYKWLRVEGTTEGDAIRKIYNSYEELYKMRYPSSWYR